MSLENLGWIKLSRGLKDKGFWRKPAYAHLWTHLLLSANHRETELVWNQETLKIKPGQFVTGRKKLAEQTGISEKTIEYILKFFQNEKQIEQQKTTKFRLITIVNWEKYQAAGQPGSQRPASDLPVDGQRPGTDKKENNDYNDQNKPARSLQVNQGIRENFCRSLGEASLKYAFVQPLLDAVAAIPAETDVEAGLDQLCALYWPIFKSCLPKDECHAIPVPLLLPFRSIYQRLAEKW